MQTSFVGAKDTWLADTWGCWWVPQKRICLLCIQVQLLHNHSLLLVRFCSNKALIMWKSWRHDRKAASTKQTAKRNDHSCQRGKEGFTLGNLPGHGGMDKTGLWAPAGAASQGKSVMGKGSGVRHILYQKQVICSNLQACSTGRKSQNSAAQERLTARGQNLEGDPPYLGLNQNSASQCQAASAPQTQSTFVW